MGIRIQHPEGLGHLGRFCARFLNTLAHPSFTVATKTMGIDSQQFSLKMTEGQANFAQGDLKPETVCNSPSCKELMDSLIRGDEGQPVCQFKTTPRMKRPIGADTCRTDSGFVNQLHRQAGLDAFARLLGPTTQQIPGSKTKMLSH
jgi:hypothetical protein